MFGWETREFKPAEATPLTKEEEKESVKLGWTIPTKLKNISDRICRNGPTNIWKVLHRMCPTNAISQGKCWSALGVTTRPIWWHCAKRSSSICFLFFVLKSVSVLATQPPLTKWKVKDKVLDNSSTISNGIPEQSASGWCSRIVSKPFWKIIYPYNCWY